MPPHAPEIVTWILCVSITTVCALTLFSCSETSLPGDSPNSLPALGTMDNSNVQFPITVYTYDSVVALNAAVRGKKSNKNQRVKGLARWFFKSNNPDQMHRCEIHVVTPQRKDGPHVMTWGHELAHCIYGTYHPESD